MYNEKLEKLIEMALMDGEITAKEKKILIKKAENFIDFDTGGIKLDSLRFICSLDICLRF